MAEHEKADPEIGFQRVDLLVIKGAGK